VGHRQKKKGMNLPSNYLANFFNQPFGHVSSVWTPTLLELKAKVEAVSGVVFNSVLLLYRQNQKSGSSPD